MSYESDSEPIKFGYLCDLKLPDDYPQSYLEDLTNPFEMIFREAREQGVLDRPVELVVRFVEGLPKGSVKAVIDGYAELVDAGCLVVYGPNTTDNVVPTKEAIERRFQVPAISTTGTDDWLGEWTFALPMGSMTDEPIFWAQLLADGAHTDVGVLIENSLIGDSYLQGFRKACRASGIRIAGEQRIHQTGQDITEQVRKLYEAKATALVHCGFGFGMVNIKQALNAIDWDPPRFMGTAFENAWLNPAMWDACTGFTGLDQYDEANPVCQDFLDRYEATYGRRPQNCVMPVYRDMATILVHAFADAHPLSPRGVKEALERVKMLPAATGSPGTRLSFGKWTRRGWMGAGYLVARTLNTDGHTSRLVSRFGTE